MHTGNRAHWLYPWDLTVLPVVASKKGYRYSVQRVVKQVMHLVGTLGVLLFWDCKVLKTLELISVYADKHLGVWGPEQDANPGRCPLWSPRKRHLSEILDQGRHVRGFWSRDEGCTSQCSLE